MHKLFIFIRSDMQSMTPGKAAAQVAHAASQAAMVCKNLNYTPYEEWENSPMVEYKRTYSPWISRSLEAEETGYTGYGTTIVLDGTTGENLIHLWGNIQADYAPLCGLIIDPTYPLRDGDTTHLIRVMTCCWVFGDTEIESDLKELVNYYPLFNGPGGM